VAHYEVSLEEFTGPLDLLLHLIRVNEMDIFDLDVARITDEYVQVIEAEGVRDLASAYHFLAMAASLVELKSRMLLPQHEADSVSEDGEEPPEDPRELLAHQLAAYQSIQDVTADLAGRYEQVGRHWPRQIVEQLEAEIVYSMDSLSVYDLMQSFQDVLSRPRFKQITIFKEDYDIADAREWLHGRLSVEPVEMRDLLYEQPDVFALIVTFIALLDMFKEQQASFDVSEQGIIVSRTSVGEVL
jgi:segregation and condensation protein A